MLQHIAARPQPRVITVVVRCYEGGSVKGCFGFLLGNSVLHRKLLFGRGGVGRQTSKRVRRAKRLVVVENRISLRDGLCGASEPAIAILDDS